MKTLHHVSIIFLILSMGFSTTLAFGHGLGGETHPPVSLDGRDVTLSIIFLHQYLTKMILKDTLQ